MNIEISKNHSVPRQASSAWQTFKDRDDWIRLFLAADGELLSCTAKIVGTRLALHHNIETGRCDPSLTELASGTGMSDRNVRRMLRELEQTGWVRVQGRGYHRSNSFELRVPEAEADRTLLSGQTDVRPDTVVRANDPRPDNPGRMTGQSGSVRPDTVVRLKENLTANKNSEEKESPQLDFGDDSGRRDQSPSGTDVDFEAWWAQVPRKVAKSAAAKMYRRIITKGEATPAELMAGILRYGAEVAGREQRFIAHPNTWLSQGRWADESVTPITGTIDANGDQIRPLPDLPPPVNAHAARAQFYVERLKAQTNGGAQ